ncbi:MAG: hypothetical protein WC528_01030 [Patescibacteria group bacterium]
MKRIILIVGALLVLILAGLALYWFYFRPSPANQNTAPENNNVNQAINSHQNDNGNENTNTAVNDNTNQTASLGSEKIRQVSRIFAERYGSYSNENDFENLVALKTYMTDKFQKETDNYITSEKSKLTGNEAYFGVISEMLSVNVISLTENSAQAAVTLRRTERNETSPTGTYFQNLSLKFVKSGNDWLVSSAAWQEKITQ